MSNHLKSKINLLVDTTDAGIYYKGILEFLSISEIVSYCNNNCFAIAYFAFYLFKA